MSNPVPPPIDNSQFTEEERTEAFRREVMYNLVKQTKSLDSIRSILMFFTILFVVGVVLWIIVMVGAASGTRL